MADLNHVTLIGRLTRDAELKYTSGGQAVCKFSVAVNRRRKNGDQWEDEANFFDTVLWGRQGEALNQYLVKGKMVGLEGELRQDRWQQDGQNRSRVEIVVTNIQLLGGGSGGGGPGGGSPGAWSGGGSNAGAGNYGGGNGGNWSNAAPPASGDSYGGQEAPPAAPASDDGFADDIPF